jgi:hypothetical protein
MRRITIEPPATPASGSASSSLEASLSIARRVTVERPMTIVVPAVAFASLTRAPPTNVPFFEPRSERTTPSLSTASARCFPLTVASTTGTSAVFDVPTIPRLPASVTRRVPASSWTSAHHAWPP